MKNILLTYTISNGTPENYKKIYDGANNSSLTSGYAGVDETTVVVNTNDTAYGVASDLVGFCNSKEIVLTKLFSVEISNDTAMMGQSESVQKGFGIEAQK